MQCRSSLLIWSHEVWLLLAETVFLFTFYCRIMFYTHLVIARHMYKQHPCCDILAFCTCTETHMWHYSGLKVDDTFRTIHRAFFSLLASTDTFVCFSYVVISLPATTRINKATYMYNYHQSYHPTSTISQPWFLYAFLFSRKIVYNIETSTKLHSYWETAVRM